MRVRRFALLGNLALGGVLMLAVWALILWVSSRPALKALIDLTPQRMNSVDPVTEELLRDLRGQKAQVEFHLFAPPQDGEGADDVGRQILRIRQRLVDHTRLLLRTYAALGAESVAVHDYDFVRDAGPAREAAARFAYRVAEGEMVVVALAMPGKEPRFRKLSLPSDLAVIDFPSTGGAVPGTGRAVAPVLRDFRGEEGISSALKSLLVTGTPVAYVLKGYSAPTLDLTTASNLGYGDFLHALHASGFDVREFDFRTQPMVPADAAVVIVLEPYREFTEVDANALFDYCRRGGRVFANYVWSSVDGWNPTGGRFGELLGYELSQAPVFHMIPGTSRTAGRGIDNDDGVMRLQLMPNAEHPTTRRLAEARRPIEVLLGREVRERAGAPAAITRIPLLRTGDQGWFGQIGAEGVIDLKAPSMRLRPYEVAMAFEVPPESDGAGARPGQVVVVGGMLCNKAGMSAGFGDFAINVCNWMAERRVLLDIRGSRYETRQMTVTLPQLENIWWLLVCGVPGAFLLGGIVVVVVRRRN